MEAADSLVREVMFAALERQTSERAGFLDLACGGNLELRRAVDRLLVAHDRAGTFLDHPPHDVGDSLIGQDLGAYRVQREIGRGGMGTVYLAERSDRQYAKCVAIKVVKRGMDSDLVLRHFRNERQILATLEHPNIGRLLDGGSTPSGSPYFVMEYIEGLPIDRYCDEHRLSIAQRVDLFRAAIRGVAYAHQRLVVHRDIKPSNILVGADGVPKLLDFGIAKILSSDDSSASLVTSTAARLMTPAYASPEQLAGAPATTLTDVYSLGVVLAEVLTGVRDADLENIVAMARRGEPERRYVSVDHFGEDLRRYQMGLPVMARPDRFGYRVGKFVRRHRAPVAMAALGLLSLIGGSIGTAWQAHRARAQQALAERRFADVRKLAHAVLFDYHDAIQDLPGATPVRERLVKDGLDYLDALAREKANDPSLQRELASAYEKVGDVQGGPLAANLGDTSGALASYRKAAALRAELRSEPTEAGPVRREDASGRLKLALLLSYAGDVDEATRQADVALESLERLVAESDGEALRFELAAAHDHAGTIALDAGQVERSLRHHRRAAVLYETLPPAARETPAVRRELAKAYVRLGQALVEAGSLEQALVETVKARALNLALAAEFPRSPELKNTLGFGHYYTGDILDRMHRYPEALREFRAGLAVVEQLVVEDPGNSRRRTDLAFAQIRVANTLGRMGRHREALPLYRSCLEQRSRELTEDPVDLWKRASWIQAQAQIGLSLANLGERSAALAAAEAAIALMDKTVLEPGNVVIRGTFTEVDGVLGEAFSLLAAHRDATPGQRLVGWSRARQHYRRSADFWQELRTLGQLSVGDAAKPDALAAEVARCDRKLTALRLEPTPPPPRRPAARRDESPGPSASAASHRRFARR